MGPMHTMGLGNIVDELHDEYSLAHASTAKEPDLATTLIGGQKVHHLQGCPAVVSVSLKAEPLHAKAPLHHSRCPSHSWLSLHVHGPCKATRAMRDSSP